MSSDVNFWEAVNRIRSIDDRFDPRVYVFVMEAVDYTIKLAGERRHISASELLDGLCKYAKERFGLLAYTVLKKWGVCSAADIGRAVYQLVNAGVLSKQEKDRFEDFEAGFDLQKALDDNYFD